VQTGLLRIYVLSPNGWMGGQIFGGMGLRTGGPDSFAKISGSKKGINPLEVMCTRNRQS
jgi:hypothetical protein